MLLLFITLLSLLHYSRLKILTYIATVHCYKWRILRKAVQFLSVCSNSIQPGNSFRLATSRYLYIFWLHACTVIGISITPLSLFTSHPRTWTRVCLYCLTYGTLTLLSSLAITKLFLLTITHLHKHCSYHFTTSNIPSGCWRPAASS